MPSYSYRTVREDVRVPLPDGTELYARLWRPVTDDPVPVVLEYSGGRLTDWTAADDARRHPWYAGHGYAAVRVDARGCGNSGGRPDDGAGEQDLTDGADLLRRLAAEPWCTGRIGLLGSGAAGAGALRLAARAPDAVHAVVTACPDGGHRLGGAALAADLHTRAGARLTDAARPPDPQYVGDDWRAMWRERLEALEPDLPARLAAGWGEPPATAAVPTLAVAGWGDPSCAAVLRLLAAGTAAVPVRALLGPWPHGLPDDALAETLRWWDHWLKGADTGALRTPALRSWTGDRWTAADPWPPPDVRTVRYGLDGPLRTAGTASDDRYVHVRSPQHTGLNAGAYVPLGRPADRPPDQREEDGRSVCFDSLPLPEPLELLGAPSLRLRLRPPAEAGPVIARLCAVAPDGTSTLLARGARLATPPAPDITVELAPAGLTVPPGHRLRLALSSTYWPWLWPDPEPAGFGLDPSHSALILPVRHLAADPDTAPVVLASPTLPLPPPVHVTEPLTARPERLTVHDIARHEWRTELSPATDGTRTHPDGLVRDEHTVTAYRILTAAPTSAQARSDRTVRLERPAIGWDITLRTRTELRCTPTHFLTRTQLTALEAGDIVFTREWQQQIPRTAP
ncbi:CocE/NonD family hydrolase [Kitasatospora sp. NBC_01246]|uniref:CocE/NonD family hydrolase n=1 Tax=Kitasatospora sp. NBC_01246 TaxID=2903570 RepID=UPI002E359FE9|nr:CocE/NonD family hydrolase [Kitasatospora sp. NBC_01246]